MRYLKRIWLCRRFAAGSSAVFFVRPVSAFRLSGNTGEIRTAKRVDESDDSDRIACRTADASCCPAASGRMFGRE